MPYIFKNSPFDYLNPIPRENLEKAIVWVIFQHYPEATRKRRGIGDIVNGIKRDLKAGRTQLIYKKEENSEIKKEIPQKSTQSEFGFANSNNNYSTEERTSLRNNPRKTFKEHFLQT
jgi:hypothetical protein